MKISRLWPWKGSSGIPPERRLSKDAVVTLVIHGLYGFGVSMAGVFLNLYLWRLTSSLFVNGAFNMIIFLVGPFAFALAGKLAKTWDRLSVYRLGILITAIYYLLIIIAKENVAEYYYLFGFIGGISNAFYWLGYLTLLYDVSTDQNRIRFLGLNSISYNTAGLIGPALAGFIITQYQGLSGYVTVFTIAFIMFVLTTIGSFQLKVDPTHHKAYYLRFMGLIMKRSKLFTKGLIGWYVIGLMQGIMLFLPNILLFSVISREDIIGYMGIIYMGLTIISSYLLSRFAKEHLAKNYIIIAAVGYTLAASFLLVGINLFTVIAFISIYYVCVPLMTNSFSAYHYRLVGKLPLKGHLRIETMVGREAFVCSGRVTSILLIILLSESLTGPLLPWIIFIAALMQFNFIWIIRKEKASDIRGHSLQK